MLLVTYEIPYQVRDDPSTPAATTRQAELTLSVPISCFKFGNSRKSVRKKARLPYCGATSRQAERTLSEEIRILSL